MYAYFEGDIINHQSNVCFIIDFKTCITFRLTTFICREFIITKYILLFFLLHYVIWFIVKFHFFPHMLILFLISAQMINP